ncbi:MAG: DUF6757 family protein [Halococcoides sp.]
MQCHYCERDADIAVEKDGIKVGLCEEHFREQIDRLDDQDILSEVDPTE